MRKSRTQKRETENPKTEKSRNQSKKKVNQTGKFNFGSINQTALINNGLAQVFNFIKLMLTDLTKYIKNILISWLNKP